MNHLVQNVLVGIVIGAVVAVAAGGEPAHFVLGPVLALSLALMLFFGSYATRRTPTVEPRKYAVAGALAVALGFAMYRFMDSEPTWWAVGFILAGSLMSAAEHTRSEQAGSRTESRQRRR